MISEQRIKEEAMRLGFAACGISEAGPASSEESYFDNWLAEGNHAGMRFMENYRDLRLDPAGLLDGARSIISVAMNYYPAVRQPEDVPQLAYYAYGKDYHDVMKEKLAQLVAFIRREVDMNARCFTDSAPILERYWAWKAGLGWIGKNTHLIIPGKGSYFFLGEIVTDLYLSPDCPMENRCGQCTRCMDACPTKAIEAPKKLNAGKCISYLTIENREEIPEELASLTGNRMYGCDTCQQVCPWNRSAHPTDEASFRMNEELAAMTAPKWYSLSREEYTRLFKGSAVKRAKFEGLQRNIANYQKNNNTTKI